MVALAVFAESQGLLCVQADSMQAHTGSHAMLVYTDMLCMCWMHSNVSVLLQCVLASV